MKILYFCLAVIHMLFLLKLLYKVSHLPEFQFESLRQQWDLISCIPERSTQKDHVSQPGHPIASSLLNVVRTQHCRSGCASLLDHRHMTSADLGSTHPFLALKYRCGLQRPSALLLFSRPWRSACRGCWKQMIAKCHMAKEQQSAMVSP